MRSNIEILMYILCIPQAPKRAVNFLTKYKLDAAALRLNLNCIFFSAR